MKKHLLTTTVATALALGAATVQAVPTLQLTIIGGSYVGGDDDTTYASDPVFTLVALLDPEGVGQDGSATLTDTYYISAAVVPKKMPPGADYGSFTFAGTAVDVTADMDYGTPPLDAVYAGLYGDLSPHEIFETYFSEFEFQFSATDKVNEFNAEDYTPSSVAELTCVIDTSTDRCIYYKTFDLNLSALSELIGIHFDLYNTDVKDCDKGNYPDGCTTLVSRADFAPFSHDAQGSSTSTGIITSNGTAPEPGTLTLFGIGILGGLFAHRRRRQMRA
jgi:hypothetical protein